MQEPARSSLANSGSADSSLPARDSNRLGVGVFGTGALARRLIADLRRLDYNVIALWGRTRAAAEKLALELKVPFFSHREEEVLLKEGVELVVLACAPHFQWLVATKALGIGRNVLLVPPFATTRNEIAQLAEKAATYGLLMNAVMQPFRYTAAFRIGRCIVQLSETYAEQLAASSQSSGSTPQSIAINGDRTSDPAAAIFSVLERLTRGMRVRGGKLTTTSANIGRLCVIEVHAESDLARRRDRFGWFCDAQMAGGALASLGASVVDALRFLTKTRCSAVRGFATTCRTHTSRIDGIREITADDFCTFQARLEREKCHPPLTKTRSTSASVHGSPPLATVTLNSLCTFPSEPGSSNTKSKIEFLVIDNDEADGDGEAPNAVLKFKMVGELGTLTIDTKTAQVRLESFSTGQSVVIETCSDAIDEEDGADDVMDSDADVQTGGECDIPLQLTITRPSRSVSESQSNDAAADQSSEPTFARGSVSRSSVRKRARTQLGSASEYQVSSAEETNMNTVVETDGVLEQLRVIRECFRTQKEQRSAAAAEDGATGDQLGTSSLRRRGTDSAAPMITSGAPMFADLPHVDEWLDVQSVIDAVRESSRTGGWCNVAPHGIAAGTRVAPFAASASSFQLQPSSVYGSQLTISSAVSGSGSGAGSTAAGTNSSTSTSGQQSGKLQSSVNEKHHTVKKSLYR